MKTLDERLGQRIARQRKAVGLSQSQLAEMVRVQPITISRIERGKNSVSLELAARIAESLEIELHEMFRLFNEDMPRDRAIEKILWFASRLSPDEIELVMDVGAAVLHHARRAMPGRA